MTCRISAKATEINLEEQKITPTVFLINGSPEVVWEDDDLLIVNKPAGMVCHSASRPGQPALVNWIREHGIEIARLMNRLDRETSGLVLIAKNKDSAKTLGKAILRREVDKQYIGICWGNPPDNNGTIEKPIALAVDSPVYSKRIVSEIAGKPSTTEYSVIQRLTDFAVVQLHPHTGRAHQLRVHLSWLGHPLVGDKIYGPNEQLYLDFIEHGLTDQMLEQLLLTRHALHASALSFQHPVTKQHSFFQSPLPSDMQSFITHHS